MVDHRDAFPAHVVEPGIAPALGPTPEVDRLTGDQVGGVDVRARAPPPLIGARDRGRAVGEVDPQLGQEGQLEAPLVVRAREPHLPAEPAVGQDRPHGVEAGLKQICDVIGLNLEPIAILGEPRRELCVADPSAVEERLVQAVGGRVQASPYDGPLVKLELAAHEHRWPAPWRHRLGLDRRDPPRGPVPRLEQPELEGVVC